MNTLRAIRRRPHHGLVKRDKLVTIRLSAEDLDLLRQAARELWPADAPPTNSTLVLTLAKQRAKEIIQIKKPKK